MRHVELVDFHRKGIAMTKQSGDLSQEKSGGWEEYPVKRGIDSIRHPYRSEFSHASNVARCWPARYRSHCFSLGFCVFLIMTAGMRMGS